MLKYSVEVEKLETFSSHGIKKKVRNMNIVHIVFIVNVLKKTKRFIYLLKRFYLYSSWFCIFISQCCDCSLDFQRTIFDQALCDEVEYSSATADSTTIKKGKGRFR